MAEIHFRQLSIIGVGLLGGSLGLAVRRARLAETVVGVGHHESSLQKALERGAIDRFALSAAEGVRGADLVVLATPVGLFAEIMKLAAPALSPGCLITDVGSTKREIIARILPHVPEGCALVGSHPLAGSELRGIDAAAADLYASALVLVTPTERSDEAAVKRVEQFWQALGSRTRRIDAETHDRLLAQTSHLPHLVAAALVESLSPEAAPLIARGFLDTTRIASGDAVMWRDIFMTNRDEVLAAVARLEETLGRIRAALTVNDSEAMEQFLHRAKQHRDNIIRSPMSLQNFRPIWSRVGNNYDLHLKNADALNRAEVRRLLEEVRSLSGPRPIPFSSEAAKALKMWIDDPNSLLPSHAYARLSNWFLTRKAERESPRGEAARQLWDDLFLTSPDKRLTDPKRNEKIIPSRFHAWWKKEMGQQ